MQSISGYYIDSTMSQKVFTDYGNINVNFMGDTLEEVYSSIWTFNTDSSLLEITNNVLYTTYHWIKFGNILSLTVDGYTEDYTIQELNRTNLTTSTYSNEISWEMNDTLFFEDAHRTHYWTK